MNGEVDSHRNSAGTIILAVLLFSVGYAKQTLIYAEENNANLISIMVNPTQENAYFADSDKEAIIMNEHFIPVLCTSDAEAQI